MRMGTKLRFWTRALELEYMALNMSPAITVNVNPANYKQNTAGSRNKAKSTILFEGSMEGKGFLLEYENLC